MASLNIARPLRTSAAADASLPWERFGALCNVLPTALVAISLLAAIATTAKAQMSGFGWPAPAFTYSSTSVENLINSMDSSTCVDQTRYDILWREVQRTRLLIGQDVNDLRRALRELRADLKGVRLRDLRKDIQVDIDDYLDDIYYLTDLSKRLQDALNRLKICPPGTIFHAIGVEELVPVVGDLGGDVIIDGGSSGGKTEQSTNKPEGDPSATSSFTQRWLGLDGRVRIRMAGTQTLPTSFVAGVKALWFSGGSTTLALNFPTGPTSLTYKRDGYVLPYVGLSFPITPGVSIVPYMGIRYEWDTATFIANETAVGGRVNTFRNRVAAQGLTVGSELETRFGQFAGAGLQPFARLGAAIDFGGGRKVFGPVSTLGGTYLNTNDPQTSYRVYAGIGLSFGAPPAAAPPDATRSTASQK